MKVSVSITDLPVFARMRDLFAGLEQTGADGVEIVSGVKSRWRWEKIHEYSEKYHLPVTSVHQPPWSGLNIYFDESNIRDTVAMGVRAFVFHPLTRYTLPEQIEHGYFAKLVQMKQKYKVDILIENMPLVFRRPFAKQFMLYQPDTMDIMKIKKVLDTYDLGFNLDTSHIFVPEPQKEHWFDAIYPRMRNIHLSSFHSKRDHLPLYLGDFNTTSFMKELKKRKYTGLITLEIFYPRMIRFHKFDYEAIRRSVEIVKRI